ncbi:HAMP domain-containing histidine kinase [Clostridium botulinum]|uniref:histidine kinase n=1 Tax=Clostridium botulinum (strain Okra / Type B1) TaxID=498213 RepID=B1IE76_CLOBK|nr:HAMP domain-containing sensor histidine kinase [Clostridium botulinum]EKX81335.1 two component sensor kinase [Clostridium botulinum CFSAN001628]ACA45625.1 two component sensor kinase [Clostridium botulinum B1 str. Okra]MBD5561541.1 HAMP domain-containing histidine kinase [Clostridium botulinum]MBD5564915.1 HAMP domain-containing histidine kinase [Clostridium botulinum]MBD5571207.1 HAMP domain-containing histidine kinase [Clostridium botulinum]
MYLLAIILFMIFIIIFSVVMCIKLFSYKRQIRDITNQVREFKHRKTNKKINIEIADKDIEELACEVNEYLELYKRNEEEKIVFENTLKQGIANMSHDLRTPLTSIIGYLKLLENDEIDKKEALDILKNKTNKLNILINDFFELASIESEDYELDMIKVNLTNIVRDEILSLYEAFQDKGLKPKINILDKPIFIMRDKDSLERIIDNLLSNTLKYAEKDIEINLEESNDKVILKISNICTSIDEKDVLHMFDRFYMADKVRKGQGTGLGLSIVKSLMEKMDGIITSKFEQNRVSIICEWKYIK